MNRSGEALKRTFKAEISRRFTQESEAAQILDPAATAREGNPSPAAGIAKKPDLVPAKGGWPRW